MNILLVYHFFHPDPVISARIFSDLAQSLAESGHKVTVYTCNRMIRDPRPLYPLEMWENVKIRRFIRPHWSQKNPLTRLCNSFFLQLKWLRFFCFKEKETYDAVIVGTDPQLCYMMFPFMRLKARKTRLIHWVFDLYPEAIRVSHGWYMKIAALMIRPLAWFAYRFVDDMVDIGLCMRRRLQEYFPRAAFTTLTPWALKEEIGEGTLPAADPEIRRAMFGNAKIGLLYSGTIGHAHSIAPFIALARECRMKKIDAAFFISGYGNCYDDQIAEITPEDVNIRLGTFVDEDELEKRGNAADIHMISLREGWGGIVLPSKFFASLAVGKPVLFSGTGNCSIVQWCKDYDIGWVLEPSFTDRLRELTEDPEKCRQKGENARRIYREHFSREKICQRWKELLETGKPENDLPRA